VSRAIDLAVNTYETRVLAPMLAGLAPRERRYLKAMAHVLGKDSTASIEEVSHALGMTASTMCHLRQALCGRGLIIACGRDKVAFNIPYLAGHLQREGPKNTV